MLNHGNAFQTASVLLFVSVAVAFGLLRCWLLYEQKRIHVVGAIHTS